jgi:pimeloyl-ACP methyl ester carboxylesterase
MRRPFLAGILILATAPVLAAAPANAAVKQGPAGDAFYTPPATLPGGAHGTPVWQRKLTGEPVLKSAKSNTLLLYRSQAVNGDTVAVSGDVAIPKGKAPKGGWPVITWAHGTVGIADVCAPSRAGTQANYDSPLLNRWLKAGYAVVRTDYEGLGTPGPHPYLIGVSEGRSTLDMVRAARKLNLDIGKQVVIAGHSQGGQAALFAASLAKKWTPELTLQGTVAFAPVSHLGEQGKLLSALTSPSGLSALVAMIVRGIDIGNPSLNVQGLLSDQAKALYPQLDEKCLGDLGKPDSFGAVAPANLFRPDADVNPVIAALGSDDDPEQLKIAGPVLIEQGTADTTVFPNFTADLNTELKANGVKVTYKTYDGVDHGGAVTAKAPSSVATKWIKTRLSR